MTSTVAKRHQDTILNSINEGVFTVDLNLKITSFNQAAEKITRVRRRDAIGRPCCEVFRANICENACAMKRTLASDKPMVNVRAHVVTSTGAQIPIRLSTAPLREADGTVVGGVETFQDLTQVEQLRKALEASYTFEDIIGR
ncbi:MAG: PAS domain-containing protein, partial [Desulfobacteraceae bacterium]